MLSLLLQMPPPSRPYPGILLILLSVGFIGLVVTVIVFAVRRGKRPDGGEKF